MSQSPLTIKILTALEEIPAPAWDRLAQGPRGGEKHPPDKDLARQAESEPHAGLPGHAPPFAPTQGEQDEAPDSKRQSPESTPEPPESTHEVAESSYEEDEDNPFISHAFLSALEDSGSVGEGTGWTPLFVSVWAQSGEVLGALPAYAKSHSRGEYVFDHAFAEAYHAHGLRYYPKLQISVPFTPARARKLLIAPQVPEAPIRTALLEGAEVLRRRIRASSIHATFLTGADRASFAEAGYLPREDRQFHFLNPGYADYEAFLETLASRKRKALRRERREALAAGIEVEWLTGKALTEAHWDAFFAFYQETGARKWGSPYLTRRFFSLVSERMSEKILLVMAKRNGRYIAGALNFIGANALYGRNWGAIEHHPFLHFELCYHQAIDFALARGLKRVEAGAQGEHKLARGYAPVATHSAHSFADERFSEAIADYLERERAMVRSMETELVEMLPFRRAPSP